MVSLSSGRDINNSMMDRNIPSGLSLLKNLSQQSWKDGVKPEPRTVAFFLYKTVGQLLKLSAKKKKKHKHIINYIC